MPDPGPVRGATGTRTGDLVPETVYGSRKRLEWILSRITEADDILEVGCGTGHMICRPLARLGFRIHGIDLDGPSIEFGRGLLVAEGLDPEILSVRPLARWTPRPDVIVVSEVLEHLEDGELEPFLAELRTRLKPRGVLLVTVPNGYGWFEMEQFLWYRLGLGRLLFHGRVCHLIESTKSRYLGPEAVDPGEPSTLAASPHVQRFTMSSIRRLLERAGFDVEDARGSVAFSGPFSNLLFAGVGAFLRGNARWGDRTGRCAAGFFLACRAR